MVYCRFGGNNINSLRSTVYHEHRRMTDDRTETESRREILGEDGRRRDQSSSNNTYRTYKFIIRAEVDLHPFVRATYPIPECYLVIYLITIPFLFYLMCLVGSL